MLEKGGGPERSEKRAYRGTHKQNTSVKPLAGKIRGADFHEYLQTVGLEDWNFKGPEAWLG